MGLDELKNIDTAAIDELRRIKQDQEVLRQRLEQMVTKQGAVSEVVYQRVRQDYESRHKELEKTARPLLEQARVGYARLGDLLVRFESALQDARHDKEECEFRHELGEFSKKEFDDRLERCDGRLEQCQQEIAEADKVKTAFLEAVHSEQELLASQKESPPHVAMLADSQDEEDERDTLTEPISAGSATPTGDDGSEPDPGRYEASNGAPPQDPKARAPSIDGDFRAARRDPETGSLQLHARLIAVLDSGQQEFPLGAKRTSIGRSQDNDIQLDRRGVARRHAEIVPTSEGFRLRDLNSKTGTRVNDRRIREHLLNSGDTIDIQNIVLVFGFADPS